LHAAYTRLSTLDAAAKAELVTKLTLGLTFSEVKDFRADFRQFAHPHQRAPERANSGADWTTWLVLGGRGAGKTRAGAQWVRDVDASDAKARIALIGETEHDAREVMVEGVSGLLAVHKHKERPEWISSRRRLVWPNGAVAQVFSAEDPESLRGPQFSAAWCDELAKWRHADATFDMLQFGLRLGGRPRQVITTTPRPIALLNRLLADARTAVTHAGTRTNAFNLAPAFVETVLARYHDTRLGRQEIEGEIIEERNDALWSRAGLENCRVAAAPQLMRIVVAVDPPASAKRGADACGIVAAGRGPDGTIYVIADETVSGASPQGWAVKAVALWRRCEADVLVAEVKAVALAMAAGAPAPAARQIVSQAPAPGRAVVPVAKGAQQGSAGAIAAAGAAAANQAHQSGARPAVMASLLIVTLALSVAGWLFWHWQQRRQQEKSA
jgi:phage terminase large subunit-like protein